MWRDLVWQRSAQCRSPPKRAVREREFLFGCARNHNHGGRPSPSSRTRLFLRIPMPFRRSTRRDASSLLRSSVTNWPRTSRPVPHALASVTVLLGGMQTAQLDRASRASNTSPYSEVVQESIYADQWLGDRAAMRTVSPVLRDRCGCRRRRKVPLSDHGAHRAIPCGAPIRRDRSGAERRASVNLRRCRRYDARQPRL